MIDIRIPNLGEGAESGTVVSVFVKEGDTVSKDQTILELENEKAVAPIPSTQAGVVKKVYVKAGDKVSVGQAIISLEETAAGNSNSNAAPIASSFAPRVEERVVSEVKKEAVSPAVKAIPGIPPPASPTVRNVAAELGIDLSQVRGSEAGGRIVMEDIRAYITGLKNTVASSDGPVKKVVSESIDFSKWGPVKKALVSSLRQKIAQKMTESWTTIPHVTQFDEADITALMALRKKNFKAYEKKGVRLTLTPFIIKAVITALKKYPGFNSSLDEQSQEIVTKEYIHIGVAVDTDSGLIVPVVRDADKKNLFELSRDLEALAEKTRRRKVSLDELRGGTFTISNLGGIGGTFFTPIINKPEAAILGVGRGVLKPVVVKGKTKNKVEERLMLPLGLSYDHRIIDGADGARFIREVVEALQNFSPKDLKF